MRIPLIIDEARALREAHAREMYFQDRRAERALARAKRLATFRALHPRDRFKA